MSDMAKWALAAQNAPQWITYAALGLFVHPKTRGVGKYAISYIARSTYAAAAARMTTPFIRGGTFAMNTFAAAAATGAAVGFLTTSTGLALLEKNNVLQSGTTEDYMYKHTSVDGLKQVYNVPKNVVAIGNHYF